MPRITVRQLQDAGASPAALDRFRKLFGDSVEVTKESALNMADDFYGEWPNFAARHFLSPTAFAEYRRVMDATRAWAEYWDMEDSVLRARAAACFARLYLGEQEASS